MDPKQAVKLCDVWFDGDYSLMAKEMTEQKDLAFSFLDTVLQQNEQKIIEEYNNSIMASATPGVSKKFSDLLL